jgi:ADP-ribose pyrophosphatase
LRARFADGSLSAAFAYDQVERTALDAVVIVAHFRGVDGVLQVFLRSALRPPAAQRRAEICPIPERSTLGHLWEVPAGLVEVHEQSEQGLRACAARELGEELGFDATATDMLPLGPSTFPAPSVLGERHFYFHCRVDPAKRNAAAGDGSPLELHAAIVAIPLADALHWVRLGEIEDAKTEIALRRMAEIEP